MRMIVYAAIWNALRRARFDNYRLNHEPLCPFINSSKRASVPHDFLKKI